MYRSICKKNKKRVELCIAFLKVSKPKHAVREKHVLVLDDQNKSGKGSLQAMLENGSVVVNMPLSKKESEYYNEI